jgi:hypothetical protein
MKSKISYLVYIVLCISISSCDYLDVVPDQVPTFDNAFSDRYTAEQFLGTCYWGMPRTAEAGSNPAMIGALEMLLNPELKTEWAMEHALGKQSPTYSINYWSDLGDNGTRSCYAGINDCNTFLENIERVPDLNRFEKDRWIAEVTLLKAYHHFFLVRYYGPICPLRENIPVGTSTQGLKIYREKIDDTFEYIVELLDQAINSGALPQKIEAQGTELGRFTEATAKAIKAKVLVYWASPLFNGNKEYESFTDHNGDPFFNQEEDPARWQTAYEACVEAITACEAAGIRLYQLDDDQLTLPSTSETIRKVNALRNSFSERWNKELIWCNTAWKFGNQYQCLPKLQAGQVFVYPILSVPFALTDAFYSDRGVPISEDTEWINSGRYKDRYELTRVGDEAHKYLIKKGETTAAMNFNRELRFYSTLGFDRGIWWGNAIGNTPEEGSQAFCLKHRYTEYSSNLTGSPNAYNATGYFPKKLVTLGSSFFTPDGSPFYQGYANPEMRFPDLLLLAAEALNETTAGENTHPHDDVYNYLNMIRERSGLEGIIESWSKYSNRPNKPLTKAGMREIIRQERKIELALESHYYWDVRRWKIAPKELNRPIQGWNVNTKTTGETSYYKLTPLYIQSFLSPRDYFAPVPQDEIIKNPNLVQNPGY